MTEEEWLTRSDPTQMLEFIRDRASDRKLRLFGAACCYRIWDTINHEQCRKAVLVAERFADSLVSLEECTSAGEAASLIADTAPKFVDCVSSCAVSWVTSTGPSEWNADAWSLSYAMEHTAHHAAIVRDDETQEKTEQIALLRDIFGNPFRPVAVDPAWLTSTVVALAAGIYEERAFDRMPILADALQDAGCESDDILNHCRDATQPHVRGCWVVDLVLGKS